MLGRIQEKMNRLHLVAFASFLASLMYSVSKYQSHLNPGAIKYGHKDEFRVFSTVWRTVVVLEFLRQEYYLKIPIICPVGPYSSGNTCHTVSTLHLTLILVSRLSVENRSH